MGLIVATERKHWKTRLLYAAMYLLLTAGALTMVYPFLIMLSGSVKDQTDFDQFEVVPSFLSDDALLFQKFERARYTFVLTYQWEIRNEVETWDDVRYPGPPTPAADDLAEFIAGRDYPPQFLVPSDVGAVAQPVGAGAAQQSGEQGVQPKVLREWRAFVHRRYGGDIARLDREMDLTYHSWDEVAVPVPRLTSRIIGHQLTPFSELFVREFVPRMPLDEFWPIRSSGVFDSYLYVRYRRSIELFNETFGTRFQRFCEIPLARRYPAGDSYAREWAYFIRGRVSEDGIEEPPGLHPFFIRLEPAAAGAYRDFLRGEYADIAAFNRAYGMNLKSFDDAAMPVQLPATEAAARDWAHFIRKGDCLRAISIDSFEFRYREFLRKKYGSLEKLNAAHHADYPDWETVPLNVENYDSYLMHKNRRAILWEFLTRNYRQAADFLFLRGRAFWVTFLYCGLNVLFHLIVNPLAAYALSRYHMRFAHWVLLFCLLTMAFPAEVGMIPRFLLIRDLGLLNTLWALLLPGVAHGFSIFILKGFFDGLPQEMYEAAVIEGAPERWMFWNVTLALTKPILAVTAFSAFLSAYGAFMFALIICPDERMWTISVWLYQFQQSVPEPVAFAALVLASLPVLGAFIVAQRFILQGIVLPVEK